MERTTKPESWTQPDSEIPGVEYSMVVQHQAGSLLTVTTLCSGNSRNRNREEVIQDNYAFPVNGML